MLWGWKVNEPTDSVQDLQGRDLSILNTYTKGDLKGAANVNVVGCSRLKPLMEGTAGLRFHASIPLYSRARKLGILNVGSASWRELSSDELKLLNMCSDLVSIAIERAEQFEQRSQMGALEERYRLARELHDTLGQGLRVISLKLEKIDDLPEPMCPHPKLGCSRDGRIDDRRCGWSIV